MGLLTALCRLNQSILTQKLQLIGALIEKHGLDQARIVYQTPCPIAQGSIGQHIRHSLDHIEKAFLAATEYDSKHIHYDIRDRGTVHESDIEKAKERIQQMHGTLETITSNPAHISLLDHRVDAYFMLLSDASGTIGHHHHHQHEFGLPSTVARELGFAAHHAIHHMAMVKIIVTNLSATGLGQSLSKEEMPADFGVAPSTSQFQHQHLL